MEKLTNVELDLHLKKNMGDYSSMVSIALLYKKLYGRLPILGMSGEQVSYVESMIDKLPDTKLSEE